MTHTAEFLVSYDLLREVMQMPEGTKILSVRNSGFPGASFVIKVSHPDLPPCALGKTPTIEPLLHHERARWDWNVDGGEA